MDDTFLTPNGVWISAGAARKRLLRVAGDLSSIGERDRAHFIRANWRRVAARPSLWQELEQHLADREEREIERMERKVEAGQARWSETGSTK